MKKVLGSIVLMLITGALSAQGLPFSMGVWGGYRYDDQIYKIVTDSSHYTQYTNRYSAVSGGVFADLTYVQLTGGVAYQLGQLDSETRIVQGQDDNPDGSTTDSQFLNITLSVTGKYPIEFPGYAVFPLVGVEYSLNVLAKDKDQYADEAVAELNDLFITVGAGFDYRLTEQWFVRVQGTYGLNVTPTNSGLQDLADAANDDYIDYGYRVDAWVGLGLRL